MAAWDQVESAAGLIATRGKGISASQHNLNSMLGTTVSNSLLQMDVHVKNTVINGKAVSLHCAKIDGQTYSVTRRFVRVISLEDDWYEDVADPAAVIATLNKSKIRADVFTFWQRLPEIEPKYQYHTEWESLAVLSIKSFDYWWSEQIKDKTRNMVRKAEKSGIEVREASYDDAFVRGMTDIFNETPVRQGRKFWHYGKDFDTVKREFSRFLFREQLIGAYYRDELVGFVMLANAGKYGVLGQIISKIEHRNKAINNALIAHTIKKCETQQLPCLVYAYWNENSLSDFKRHCGFEHVKLPRYFIPLTVKGTLALRCGVHRDWRGALPRRVRDRLKQWRNRWYAVRW